MTRTATKPAGDGEGYALLVIEPLRAIRTAFDHGDTVSIPELARTYRHLNTSDYHRIKLHENVRTDEEAKLWLLRHAASLLAQWVVCEDDVLRLRDGCQPSDLQGPDGPIHPNVEDVSVLKAPFDPMLESGIFAQNIRAKGKDDLSDLIESMRTFGWIPYHPAIVDENGVVLVGHRRLAAAKELGILIREKHEIVTVNLGSGDPGDAERLRLALASNLASKPFNAADRKRVAQRLYGTGEWSMREIAELLRVTEKTISVDLINSYPGKNKRAEKRGRKKLGPTPRVVEATRIIRDHVDRTGEAPTRRDLEKEGVTGIIAVEAIARHELTEPVGDPLRAWWLKMLAASPVPLTRERVEMLIEEFRMYGG